MWPVRRSQSIQSAVRKKREHTVNLPPAHVIPQMPGSRIQDGPPVERGQIWRLQRHGGEIHGPVMDVICREGRHDG